MIGKNAIMEKTYKVCRYFDTYYEATVASGLTLEEAKALADKYNSQPRAYVSYEIRDGAE